MTTEGAIKYGQPGRNEVFTLATSIECRDGNDAIYTGLIVSTSRFITFVGGAGNDIIQPYFVGPDYFNQVAAFGSVIFGDTGREADVAAAGSGSDHILGFSTTDTIFAGGGDDYVNAHDGDDDIYGGAGADYLLGGKGADRIAGDAGNDVIYGATPASVQRALLSIVISYNGDNDTNIGAQAHTGLAGDMATVDLSVDILEGGAGNDYLHGGGGSDQMTGGIGNDTFIVDSPGDKVFETAGQGADAVYSSASYTLAAGQHIETISTTLTTGTGTINLVGNELAQRINGNNGANAVYGMGGNDTLYGYAGNDWIKGGPGNDILYGGAGLDNFIFDAALSATINLDRIGDFNVAQDTIRIDNAVMPGLGTTLGTLASGKFWKSTAGVAHDVDDRIIYDTDTGRLFYDSNGNAAGGAIQFAVLAPNLALAYADFVVT